MPVCVTTRTTEPHSKLRRRKGMDPSRKNLFRLCSLLMGFLFAYSASVQLNDPDWYLWFPLYSCACVVNLANCIISAKINRQIATTALFMGVFLFVKVLLEDIVYGISGIWSLDLSERVVREKTGSLLVIISMILHMEASSSLLNDCAKKNERELSGFVEYGMLALVTLSFMLPFVFFVVQKGEMKF